jgi:vancomycin permeability regulator SanA
MGIIRIATKKKTVTVLVRIAIVFLSLLVLCAALVIGISEYVRLSQIGSVFDSAAEVVGQGDVDCVLVLGAGLQSDGTPSHMLEDRIKVGVEVFKKTGAEVLLMSGDRSSEYYDEPAAMKKYAEEMGVDPSEIIMDKSGFSTYESIMRVKEEYGFDNIIVITQKYHLYRALYIADSFDVNAVGVSADLRPYRNQFVREVREILARVKDFVLCL